MPIPLNALLMLAATLAGFMALARLFQAARSRRPKFFFPRGAPSAGSEFLAVEHARMIDAKRRLVLVRCEQHRVLLLTGGPTDLVLVTFPPAPAPAP
jgi:hypothetical protein